MAAGQETATLQNQVELCAARVTVLDDLGLHARPAANLAKLAQNFEADISICLDGQTADAKSILDILSLAAARDSELELTCRGRDAKGACEALTKLFESRFSLPGAQ